MRAVLASILVFLAVPAVAAPPVAVVHAVDEAGGPVSSATVVIGDGPRQRVNTYTGEWVGDRIEAEEPVEFARGMEIDVWVSAPGHEPVNVTHKLTGSTRGNLLTVTLPRAAAPPELSCLEGVPLTDLDAVDRMTRRPRARDCRHEARAWAGFLHWAALEDRIARHPLDRPDALVTEAEAARGEALARVKAWLQAAGEEPVEAARSLCVVLSGSPRGC